MISNSKHEDAPYDSGIPYFRAGGMSFLKAIRNAELPILRGVKNASHLAIGNLLGQIIGLVGFTYIARVLGPNDYGIYVTVGAFVGMFDFILLSGLNKVIIREGSRYVSLMHHSLEKTIGVRNVLILLAIAVCMASSFFTPYAFQTKLYVVLFSFHLVYTGLQGLLETVYQATEQMRYIACLTVLNRTLSVGLSIAFLYYGFGLLALFLIILGSDLFTTLVTYRYAQKLVPFRFFSKVEFDKNLLKPAAVFSLLYLVGFFSSKIDLLMLSFLGETEQVGVYGVAYKIALQGEMLRNVFAIAFFPILVKRFHSGAVNGRRLINYSFLFFVGILVLSVPAFYAAPSVVSLLFGTEYAESATILKVLIFYLAFSWASLPFTSILQATHNERSLLVPTLALGGLNILFNYLLFLRYGPIGIAYSTLIVQAFGLVLYGKVCYKSLRKQQYLV